MAGIASVASVSGASTQDDATAGVSAAVALPPMYASEDPAAQQLFGALVSVDKDVSTKHGLRVFSGREYTHIVMGLPAESGVAEIRVLDMGRSLISASGAGIYRRKPRWHNIHRKSWFCMTGTAYR